MAAGRLAAPGTKYGPCVKACKHTDCNLTKRMATSNCTVCGQIIDYETPFYRGGTDTQLYHAYCEEAEIEAGKYADNYPGAKDDDALREAIYKQHLAYLINSNNTPTA